MCAFCVPVYMMTELDVNSILARRVFKNLIPLFYMYLYTFGFCDALCAWLKLYRVKSEKENELEEGLIVDDQADIKKLMQEAGYSDK